MFATIRRWIVGRRGRRSGTASRTAILYTRDGCHLCDEARAVLERGGYRVQPIDIEHDPSLVARFGCEIPVVEIDGKIRFRGIVDPILLNRIPSAGECADAGSNAGY